MSKFKSIESQIEGTLQDSCTSSLLADLLLHHYESKFKDNNMFLFFFNTLMILY